MLAYLSRLVVCLTPLHTSEKSLLKHSGKSVQAILRLLQLLLGSNLGNSEPDPLRHNITLYSVKKQKESIIITVIKKKPTPPSQHFSYLHFLFCRFLSSPQEVNIPMIVKSKEVSWRLSYTATEFSLQKPAFLFCAVGFCIHPPMSKTLDRDTMQQQLLCTWLTEGRCRSPFFTTSPLLQHRNTAPHIEKESKQ